MMMCGVAGGYYCNVVVEASPFYTGDTGSNGDLDSPILKPRKRRHAMNGTSEYNNNNTTTNNNAPGGHGTHGSPGAVKSERLSPGTPDTLSRSRSVTPSSASYPGTPPAVELAHPAALNMGRNYSDFMRSLAAKYNNTNPNDYFGTTIRNGYPLLKPPTDFPPTSPPSKSKHPSGGDMTLAAAAALLNPFATPSPFPPLIDMSSTHALLAMVRNAKEAEVQGLLKKRSHPGDSIGAAAATVPLDLSAAAVVQAGGKRARTTPPAGKEEARSQHQHQDGDIAAWTVEDVCSFVASIDICAEYAQKFREQRIDGSGLPLLTEDHLTSTMGLKLGPALKLRSLLARKTGSCSVCLHCVHCHSSATASTTVDDIGTSGAPT